MTRRRLLRIVASASEEICDVEDCGAPATLRPVLLLRPHRNYIGPPGRVPIDLKICDAHKEDSAQAYLEGFEGLWERVLAGQPGGDPPERRLTRVDFEALPDAPSPPPRGAA